MLSARQKAADSGQVTSYVSIANACADTFCADFESLFWVTTVADLENMYGNTEISLEIFDEALKKFQAALELQRTDDPIWQYVLTDPSLAMGYAGIEDKKTVTYLAKIIEDATVTIQIHNTLSLYARGNEEDNGAADGDVIDVADIIFSVQLEKGTWKITQVYRLSGEKIVGLYGDAQNKFYIDGSEAVCQLESQIVTRNNYGDADQRT